LRFPLWFVATLARKLNGRQPYEPIGTASRCLGGIGKCHNERGNLLCWKPIGSNRLGASSLLCDVPGLIGYKGDGMRFGVCYNIDYHPEVHGSPQAYLEEILGQVELLEDLGYDSVWFSEHHDRAYSFGSPCVLGAAAAARTKRIRIGIGVSLLPLQHPIMLAEQYGMLDGLSGGRLEYGIGRGFLPQEYEWLKVPMAESHSRYREAAEFIIKAWTQHGPISFHGEHFDVDGYEYFPAPVQKPHPPIYASAGGTEDSFRWAGAKGLNLGTALFVPDRSRISAGIDLYRRTLLEHGHDPATREISAITQMYCAPTQAEAVRDGGDYATNYYRFFANLSRQTEFYTEVRGQDLNADNRVLFGDPENLRSRIAQLRDELGLGLLLMEVAQGRAPPAKVRATLELFGREVMPHLQSRDVPSPAGHGASSAM
jgi:alkanesulfonate monooxygenase SsuD/methylene tetrahydromethanopterin reductase-like flavin-dependent oxidoreductase (luciferase family)